jgi:hypothetical protein
LSAITDRPLFRRRGERPADAAPPGRTAPPRESALMRKGDRYLLIAIVIGGTWAFGVFAIPFMYLAYRYYTKAQKEGTLTRPWSVTIIAAFCLIDSSINFFGWGSDLLWSHNTGLMKTLWPGYGKLVDGAYYIDYNGGPLGGLSNYSEKTLEVFGVLTMYPMRIASCWAFLKMKRWGLQGMIITSYMYIGFWLAYVANEYQDFSARIGASAWGNIGTWFILIVYATPFVIMPYLYTINRDLFRDEP